MKFGLNFFPSSQARGRHHRGLLCACLPLAARADELGYSPIRTVKHSFYDYGGHSPNQWDAFGKIEPSMQINFGGGSSDEEAFRTLELFVAQVMPRLN